MPTEEREVHEPVYITALWNDRYESRQVTDAPKGFFRDDYITPQVSRKSPSKAQPMRLHNRSIKQRRQWQTSVPERSVLRYTVGG